MKRKGKAVRRIGDVARAGGVGVETIRFYEREGLIERPEKPMRGWREYGERQLAQLSYVRLGQELGLTLADVRALQTDARGDRARFCGAVRNTVAKRLVKIERDMAALERKRAGLAAWLAQCKARGETDDCPLYAQLKPIVARSKRRS